MSLIIALIVFFVCIWFLPIIASVLLAFIALGIAYVLLDSGRVTRV